MLKHILVAIDFSPAWPQVQAQLNRLPALGCERLTLAYVIAEGYTQAPEVSHREHYEGRLAEIAEELAAQTGLTVESTVRVGSVANELIAAAQTHGADTILAGTHGHGVIHDFLLGNTVLDIARLADRPLLLAPVNPEAATTQDAIRNPLLATDGSPAAAGAEAAFVELLARAGHGVIVSVGPWDGQPDASETHADIKNHVRDLVERAEGNHVDIELIDDGKPSQVIAQMAEKHQADLVIVGRRGHNPIIELLLGSTAEAVCRQARQLVLLVPQQHGGG